MRPRLATSMFLLSNLRAHGLADQGGRFHGPYAAAWDGDEIVGVVCHYRRGNVAVNAPTHAAELTRAALRASARPLSGAVGPEAEVDEIVEVLGVRGVAQCDERETLYSLALDDLRLPPGLRDGTVHGRAPTLAELPTLVEWTVRYRVELVGDPETEALRRSTREALPQAIERGEVWVLEHDGELVAKTAFNARLPEAVQVGGVWVPHALRGRGFGRSVVASHLRAAHRSGATTGVLFTGDDNRPARRAYEALGFEPVGRYRVLVLREPWSA